MRDTSRPHGQLSAGRRRALTRQLTRRSGIRRRQTARIRRAQRTASPTSAIWLRAPFMWCVALFDMVHFIFALSARGWASFARATRRGAARTHPNIISHRRVGVCLRVPHTSQVLTAAQLQVALLARALGCSSLVGTRVCGWASWASGDITRATPRCRGFGGMEHRSLVLACSRYTLGSGGARSHRVRRSQALWVFVVVGENRGTFPCTRNEWYKHIFWPVHTNSGDHSCLRYGVVNFAPYSQLAIKMRLPKHTTSPTHSRGSTKLDATFLLPLYRSYDILTTERCDKLNKLKLRTAPPVRLRLQYASLSAYHRIVKPTLAQQFQSTIGPTQNQSSAMATTMSLTSSPMHALTSIMASQLEQNQDALTPPAPR